MTSLKCTAGSGARRGARGRDKDAIRNENVATVRVSRAYGWTDPALCFPSSRYLPDAVYRRDVLTLRAC